MSTLPALDVDPDEIRFRHLIDLLLREADALSAILPAAVSAQWTAAPVARLRSDTAERPKGIHSDPTASAALDSRRLQLRSQVVRSQSALRDAVITMRGVRRGLEMAVAAWDGGGEDARG